MERHRGDVAAAAPPLPSLADLAELRSLTYTLAARTLLYPTAERRAAVSGLARELIEASDGMLPLAVFGDWRELVTRSAALAVTDSPVLEQEYMALFAASSASAACPPYESAWLACGTRTGLLYAALEREYARAGLERASETSEPPDHVALELEFMAMHCAGEAEAWRAGDGEGSLLTAGAAMRAAGGFMDAHLCEWLPRFAAAVAVEDPHRWGPLAERLTAFVLHDRNLIRLLARLADDDAGDD